MKTCRFKECLERLGPARSKYLLLLLLIIKSDNNNKKRQQKKVVVFKITDVSEQPSTVLATPENETAEKAIWGNNVMT